MNTFEQEPAESSAEERTESHSTLELIREATKTVEASYRRSESALATLEAYDRKDLADQAANEFESILAELGKLEVEVRNELKSGVLRSTPE